MVHVSRKAGYDVGGGVIRQLRDAGRVEDVEHVVHYLDHVAIAGAHALVGRLDRKLVSPAGVALLVMVQAGETKVELRIRLGLLAARR